MMLQLRLPFIEKGVDDARVVKWLIAHGDRVEPGEDIMVIDSETRTKLEVPRNAKLVSRLNKAAPRTGTRQVKIRVRLRLTATEPAIARELLGVVGRTYRAGDLLGTFTTDRGEELADGNLRSMKVVVNTEEAE